MFSPKEIAQNYITLGEAKAGYSVLKMLVLGVMAGMFVALAGVGATISQTTVAGTSIAYTGKLLGALVFTTGLAMVLIAGSELFTGNCLIIVSVLAKSVKPGAMLKNWFFVYLGNFIGGFIVVLITVYGGTYSSFGNLAAVTAITTAVSKVSLSFGDALLRGILCNFLVCVAVWMAFAAKDVAGKIAALFLPIMLFVLCGYEHCIANAYFIPTGLLAARDTVYLGAYYAASGASSVASLTWGAMFVRNIIPSTLGNIIGGAGMVGAVYWFAYIRLDSSPKTGGL